MDIRQFSGDSNARNLSFEHGSLSFIYEDNDSDNILLVKISSTVFISESLELIGTAHVELLNVAEYLFVDEKSLIYILGSSFIEQIKAIKKSAHLAVGMKVDKVKYIFRVCGDGLFLAVPLLSLEQISVSIV